MVIISYGDLRYWKPPLVTFNIGDVRIIVELLFAAVDPGEGGRGVDDDKGTIGVPGDRGLIVVGTSSKFG